MTRETLETEGATLTVYFDGPDWDGAPSATIGDFSCQAPEAGAALLAQALDRIRAIGRDRVIGPMSGDTWHSYRFVSDSDGSPPFLLEPSNTAEERAVFHQAGFTPIGHYFSARLTLGEAKAKQPRETRAFTVETWDGSDPDGLLREVFDLSLRAFADNAFYTPITQEAFLALYRPIVPLLRKDLVFFARRPDHTLSAFLFAIPNHVEGPNPSTVIIKTYASVQRGAGGHLAHACHEAARALGFKAVIHALIHDANQSANRSAAEGATLFRRYELLGLRLGG